MSEPRSRSVWAEERLRRAIVSGELAAGERVRVEPLAEAWELSATPLREALRTLAGEGLILLDAQRGATVAPVSPAELAEVYELRLIVEPFAFRLSLKARDDAWLRRLDAAWSSLRAVQSSAPATPLDLEPAHTDFHLALVGNCGSQSLLRLVGVLTIQALRFRTLAARARPGGNRRSLAEHRRLYELARDGDVDEGARLLAAHLAWPLGTIDEPSRDRVYERLSLLVSPEAPTGRSRA